ncbi:hypothetical protein ACHAPU_010440 [Fusarium lateritium]
MRFAPLPLVVDVVTRVDSGARTVAGVAALEKGPAKLIPIPLVSEAVTLIDTGARSAVSAVVGEKEPMKIIPIPPVAEAITLADNEAPTTAGGFSSLFGKKEAPGSFIDSIGESWRDRAEKNVIASNIPILTNIEKAGERLVDSAGQRLKDPAENNITSKIPILNNINDVVIPRSKEKEGWSSLGDYIPGVGHVVGVVNLVTGNTDGHRCSLGAKCMLVAKCIIGATSTAVMSCATAAIKAYATAYATAAVKAGVSSALGAGTTIATGGVGLVGGAVAKGAGAALGGVASGIKTATFGKLPSLGATKAASRLMSFPL